MRMAMLPLLLLGCSSTETPTAPYDAGTVPDASQPAEDAGADADVPCVPTESCGLMELEACDGGVVYGCTKGSCPTVEAAGACRVLAWSAHIESGRSCCENAVCTRSEIPTDEVCSRPQTDAGAMRVGWVCPKSMKPEGKCLGLHGAASQEFCCEE